MIAPDITNGSDPATEFFTALEGRGREPLLGRVRGSLRFDLHDDLKPEQWYIDIDYGTMTVSHRADPADAVVRIGRDLANRVALGTANVNAAVLRGEVEADGDLHLLLLFQRLFPGPPEGTSATKGQGATR
jgi:hypothetical protein